MRPKRSLGQNFLKDENVVRTIVDSLGLKDEDLVMEIGPGRGALTHELIDRGVSVTAVEIDHELIPVLKSEFSGSDGFGVVEGDYLELSLGEIIHVPKRKNVKIVGNLPYYISTAILQKLASEREMFSLAVLMLQREVVDRIIARPGNSDRGFLTVLIESAFQVERVLEVPPGAFYPRPKVSSSVISLIPKEPSFADDPSFHNLLSTAFKHKRKTIQNNLRSFVRDPMDVLRMAGIDPMRRAETLTLDEWKALAEAIHENAGTL